MARNNKGLCAQSSQARGGLSNYRPSVEPDAPTASIGFLGVRRRHKDCCESGIQTSSHALTSRILSVIVWMIGQDEFRAEAYRNRAAKCSLDEYIRSVLGMVDEEGRRDGLVRCSTTSAETMDFLGEPFSSLATQPARRRN